MASAFSYFKRQRCILKAFLDPALSSVCVDRTASEAASSFSVGFSRKNMVTPFGERLVEAGISPHDFSPYLVGNVVQSYNLLEDSCLPPEHESSNKTLSQAQFCSGIDVNYHLYSRHKPCHTI